MNTRHTPGPWAWRDDGTALVGNPPEYSGPYCGYVWWPRNIGGEVDCRVDGWSAAMGDSVGDDAQAEANARLIAAAPELLEALQESLRLLEAALTVGCEFQPGSVGWKAHAAIAKATGQSPFKETP